MKLLGCYNSVRSLALSYHPTSQFHHGNFRRQSFRNMATGLIYVSSKPLDLHPNSPASKTVKKLMKEITGYLQTYDVIYDDKESRPRGLALSLIVDFASTERQLAHMQPFPAQTRESIDAENKSEAYDEPLVEDPPDLEEVELPPELQPVLMESGLPRLSGPVSDIKVYSPDFDPDALDYKNLPNFDPVEDGEAEFYTDDAITAWIKADQEECARGAKPRLYKSIDMTNDPSGGSNPTEHSEPPCDPCIHLFSSPHLPLHCTNSP